MNKKFFLASVLIMGCSEQKVAPVDPNIPPTVTPENPPQTQPPSTVDPNLPTLAITGVLPKVGSTLGNEKITITGTGFDAKSEVFFNGTRADIDSMTATQIVAYTPASLPWGVPISIAVRRGADGARKTNDATTPFKFYASTVDFRLRDRYNQQQYGNVRAFQLMDTNKDGKLDLVINNADNTQYPVYLNNGAGNMISTYNSANVVGITVLKTVAADLNNDGAMDMVFASDSNNYFWYELADGTSGNLGNSRDVNSNYYGTACQTVQSVAVGLVNNDALPDVAATCYSNANIRVWLNQNNNGNMFGGVNAGSNLVLSTPSTNSTHATFVDLDKDGRQDLVVTNINNQQPSLYVWKNNNYSFSDADRTAVGTNSRNENPYWVTCKDLNNDTYPDCVVTDNNTNSVRIFMNNGAGVLQAPATNVFIPVGFTPWEVAIDDVNGDGNLDLMIATYNGSGVDIIFGKGDGTFPTTVTDAGGRVLSTRVTINLNCRYGRNVQFADIDGDGVKELAASCQYGENNAAAQGGVLIFKNVSR